MTSRLPHESVPGTGVGVISDLKRARRDGSASLAELREFVGQMRGRSPQEVLGMVSASELVRGVAIATVVTVLGIALFTIGPYLLIEKQAAKKPVGKAASAAESPDKAATPVVAATSADESKKQDEPDASAAAKALNIDEVKTAAPDVNPLDKDLDKLLDGKE